MKILGIISTVLAVVFLSTSVWFYSQKSKLQDDLSATQAAKESVEKQLATIKDSAGQKIEILHILFNYPDDKDKMLQAKELIKKTKDATLSADWEVLEKTGDTETATKLFKDLISALAKDIELTLK